MRNFLFKMLITNTSLIQLALTKRIFSNLQIKNKKNLKSYQHLSYSNCFHATLP